MTQRCCVCEHENIALTPRGNNLVCADCQAEAVWMAEIGDRYRTPYDVELAEKQALAAQVRVAQMLAPAAADGEQGNV